MGSKSNDFSLLQSFIFIVQTQFQTKMQSIRSNNALELVSSNHGVQLFRDQGIILQTICLHIPQKNSVVERKHKYLLETSRTLLFQSKLPIRFWGNLYLLPYTLSTDFLLSCYMINPFLNFLMVMHPLILIETFGCLYFHTIPKYHRDKFHPSAGPYVFIGCPLAKMGFKFYNLSTKQVLVSRNVTFLEHVFLFDECATSSSLPLHLLFLFTFLLF